MDDSIKDQPNPPAILTAIRAELAEIRDRLDALEAKAKALEED